MEIQRRQQALVYVSGYHIHTASKVLTISPDTTSRALAAVGCQFWPGYENCPSCWNALELPTSTSEQWMTLLHFGHTLSSFFETSRPKWCKWLNETGTASCVPTKLDSSDVRELIDALGRFFDKADVHVDEALTQLRAKGFGEPDGDHVIHFIMGELQDFPLLLIRAAVSFRLGDEQVIVNGASSLTSRTKHEDVRNLFNSSNEYFGDDDESFGFWGFRDSGFVVQAEQSGRMSVTMKGTRYGICGKSLKKLIPFIENETKTRIDPFNESALPPLTLDPLRCNLCQEDVEILQATITKISLSASDRARHGSGHSQEDMYLIRSGSIDQIRLPDAVVWPSSEDEVGQLVSMAKSKEWCLIPFGGGTNVSHATRCPAKEVEPRPILSVDMRLMKCVLWVNEEDGLAHVEAGITGRDLVQEMLLRGYTMGHEPDSIEFSTLGGWIATKASGMKRNKYGNIEDIVKSVRVAGSEGVLWRGKHGEETSTCGRESRGIDLLSITVGSEGCFGIITSAVIRIWPLPECQEYDSVILPDFEHGLRFSRDVARLGSNLPSSVRLLDNEHFRLGQALQGGSTVIERGLTYLWKMTHPVARSCSAESAVCATIAFEGTREDVESQRRAIRTLASRHGGTCVGARVGKSGYELTFAIAYLRDFAMTYNFLAESFETFAPWSKVESIIRATKERIKKEHRLRCLPGEPFIGSRVTQLYHEGACLYFYFCMNIRGVKNPCSVFAEIEHAAREEILDRGGSLSHHHGIGKIRSEFNKKMDSDAFHSFLASLKRSVDPSNTFGARNGAIE
jgi:alkyldihydroxyacetonephosphate synthase